MVFTTRIAICLIALHIRSSLSTCSDCCSPGGSCESAFHGDPGVCCGFNQCCPTGAYCMRCGSGFRCTNSPYGRCEDGGGQGFEAQLASLFFTALLLSCLAISVCQCVNERARAQQPAVGHPIVTPGGQIVASPLYQAPYAPQHDGAMSGLVTGMVLGTVLADMDEPPTYVEATDAGYEPDTTYIVV